jgi:hypothetical protein
VSRLKILVLVLVGVGVCAWLIVHRMNRRLSGDETAVENPASPSQPSRSSKLSVSQEPLPAPLEAKKEQLLTKVFPDNDTGRALADTMVLFPQGSLPEIHRQEAGRMAAELASLRNHPDQTVATLREGLKNLPDEYAEERQFLIQFASRLDADRSAITEMLAGEMKVPVKLPQDKSLPLPFYNPATALDAMIDVGIEPSKIKQALMDALDAQPDPAARLLLIGRYERLDGPGAAKLMEAYQAPNNP